MPIASFQNVTILADRGSAVLKKALRMGLILTLVTPLVSAATPPLFPFPPPPNPSSKNITDLSGWNAVPAGKFGFIKARGSHLYEGKNRIRLLGVNIVAGSAFPDKNVADQIAGRLARFGINIVRLHHLDTRPSPDGLLKTDMLTFDPDQIDRLDYLIFALKRRGIYIDLNLHVGRTYPGFMIPGSTTPKYWKGVDNFNAGMIDLQREYARKILTHVNAHTKIRYSDDPAIALIEINNENGLIHQWLRGELDEIAEVYKEQLNELWTAWLTKRYSGQPLPWATESEGSSREPDSGRAERQRLSDRVRNNWTLQTTPGVEASFTKESDGTLQLEVMEPGSEPWNAQLHMKGLALESQQRYTLKFKLRADGTYKLRILAAQDSPPWNSLWQQTLTVTPQWQTFTFYFWPGADESNARLTLNGLGSTAGTIWVADTDFQPDSRSRIRPAHALSRVTPPFIPSKELSSHSPAMQSDWLKFLWETEQDYWKSMSSYLRKQLGVKSLLIGTPANYSPGQIQAMFDVVDGHAYWEHPVFPSQEWDPENWKIGNTPMAGRADAGTIADLAYRRVPGKPFVVTEYNHPAPSSYQAEAFPLISAYAGLQDWDGLFVYSYGAHHGWQTEHVDDYFDIHANPVKLSSLIAAAAMFRRYDVSTSGSPESQLPGIDASIKKMRMRPDMPSAIYFGAARNAALRGSVSLASGPGTQLPLPVISNTGELTWGVGKKQRTVLINTPRSKALIGEAGQHFELGDMGVEITHARNNWATMLITTLQSQQAAKPGRLLVTLLGDMENTDQRWTDQKKRSVGNNWGRPPVLIEGISAILDLPHKPNQVKAWALDEAGNRRISLPVYGDQRAQLRFNESFKTLWYEIETVSTR